MVRPDRMRLLSDIFLLVRISISFAIRIVSLPIFPVEPCAIQFFDRSRIKTSCIDADTIRV